MFESFVELEVHYYSAKDCQIVRENDKFQNYDNNKQNEENSLPSSQK